MGIDGERLYVVCQEAFKGMNWRDQSKAFMISYALPIQLAVGLLAVAAAIASISWIAFTFFPNETKQIKTQMCISSGKCTGPPTAN
ncbi:MAG: hypothetical protein CL862_06255 [Cyanobium sp. NAT70]|mgnify:CR=1 FL=1|nr:hypothetical protein [Cyanobium sp. NAT70]|tara:strand:+ start:928 stop:1185 length:258 start_codon:yes stop_codon:yes gene_type:complete